MVDKYAKTRLTHLTTNCQLINAESNKDIYNVSQSNQLMTHDIILIYDEFLNEFRLLPH